MTNIIINCNPIEKKDLKLEVIQSQGAFEICQTLDKKRFYLVSVYRFNVLKNQSEIENYFYFIAKTSGKMNFSSRELSFYVPTQFEELKEFDFYSCQTERKAEDLYFINPRSIMARFDFECLKLMTAQFSKLNFKEASGALKNQAAVLAKSKKVKRHIGTSNAEYKKGKAFYLKQLKKDQEENAELVKDVL